MKEKILHNPIKPRMKKDGDHPWGFKAPSYDTRSSCSISAGDDYGVGYRTPVGKDRARSLDSGPIPQKAHMFEADSVIKEDIEG